MLLLLRHLEILQVFRNIFLEKEEKKIISRTFKKISCLKGFMSLTSQFKGKIGKKY
jgi:hypothetical protein